MSEFSPTNSTIDERVNAYVEAYVVYAVAKNGVSKYCQKRRTSHQCWVEAESMINAYETGVVMSLTDEEVFDD